MVLLGSVVYHWINKASLNGIKVPGNDLESVAPFKVEMGIAFSLPLQGLAFACHPQVPRVYHELHPSLRHRSTFILTCSTCFACAFYLAMSISHFWVMDGNPSDDLLGDYSTDDLLMNVARATLSLVQIIKTPLVYQPLRGIVHAALKIDRPVGAYSDLMNIIESLLVYGAIMAFTLMVPQLGTLMNIIGSTCGVCIAFILPGRSWCWSSYPCGLYSYCKAASSVLNLVILFVPRICMRQS